MVVQSFLFCEIPTRSPYGGVEYRWVYKYSRFSVKSSDHLGRVATTFGRVRQQRVSQMFPPVKNYLPLKFYACGGRHFRVAATSGA